MPCTNHENEVDNRTDPQRAYFKPFVTRTPVLVFLLCITIVLISLVELACHRIYAHNGAGSYGNFVGIHKRVYFELQRDVLAFTVCKYRILRLRKANKMIK